jgi:hypothetical protein
MKNQSLKTKSEFVLLKLANQRLQGFIFIRIMVCGLASLQSTYLFSDILLLESILITWFFSKRSILSRFLDFDRVSPSSCYMRLNYDFFQVKILLATFCLLLYAQYTQKFKKWDQIISISCCSAQHNMFKDNCLPVV